MTAELYLLLACTVLAAALIVLVALGRYDARNADQLVAQRDEARRERDEARAERDAALARAIHFRERNEQLRDELDGLTGAVRPSLVTEMTAFLATVKPEDFR